MSFIMVNTYVKHSTAIQWNIITHMCAGTK